MISRRSSDQGPGTHANFIGGDTWEHSELQVTEYTAIYLPDLNREEDVSSYGLQSLTNAALRSRMPFNVSFCIEIIASVKSELRLDAC